MQEEVENRTVTLTISGAKLTGRTLKWAIRQFLNHHSKSQAKKAQAAAITPRGKQSVAELVGQNQGVQNIEISDKNIKDFDRVARKYGIDYAVKKDTTEEIPKYLVFFQGAGRRRTERGVPGILGGRCEKRRNVRLSFRSCARSIRWSRQ